MYVCNPVSFKFIIFYRFSVLLFNYSLYVAIDHEVFDCYCHVAVIANRDIRFVKVRTLASISCVYSHSCYCCLHYFVACWVFVFRVIWCVWFPIIYWSWCYVIAKFSFILLLIITIKSSAGVGRIPNYGTKLDEESSNFAL